MKAVPFPPGPPPRPASVRTTEGSGMSTMDLWIRPRERRWQWGKATRNQPADLLKGAIAGAIGGLVASFVMDGLQHTLAPDPKKASGAKQHPHARQRKREALKGEQAPEPATQQVAAAVAKQAVGVELNRAQKEVAG